MASRNQMISIKHNFLFIHVPKTGGTSIQSVLHTYADDELIDVEQVNGKIERFELQNKSINTSKHSSLLDYKNKIEKQTYDGLYKIATIRNPWEMMISMYFCPHRGQKKWDRNLFVEQLHNCSTMKDYFYIPTVIERINRRLNFNLLPLSLPALDAHVDCLMRFETLNSDFDKVCRHIGIEQILLPHSNAASNIDYREYYDQELIDAVHQKFKAEIEFGSYTFEL